MVDPNGNDGKPSESLSSSSPTWLQEFLEATSNHNLTDLEAIDLPPLSFEDIRPPTAPSSTQTGSRDTFLIQILEEAQRIVQSTSEAASSVPKQAPSNANSNGKGKE